MHNLLLVRLAVEGTLRRAELTGLRSRGFDSERRVFAVTAGVTATRKTGITVGEPKNEASIRDIVRSRDLCDLLAFHRVTCGDGAAADHFLFPGRVPGRRAFDPTRPQHPESTGDQAVRLIEGAGLLDTDGKPLTNLQGLRSTGSSIADAAGIANALIEA